MLLTDLSIGDSARITGFREINAYARQLMRLGMIRGTQIRLTRRAPLGDPVEVQFRGFSLMLRPHEADCLELAPLDNAASTTR